MFTVLNSGSYIVAGYLYLLYPDLTPYQLVFLRSVFSLVYLVLMINKDVKRIFFTDMKKKYLGPLIFRTFQSTISSLINMVAVLHVDVVVVSLLNNTTPMFVCLLAMCFLKERLKRAEVFFMTLTLAAVVVIIVG